MTGGAATPMACRARLRWTVLDLDAAHRDNPGLAKISLRMWKA